MNVIFIFLFICFLFPSLIDDLIHRFYHYRNRAVIKVNIFTNYVCLFYFKLNSLPKKLTEFFSKVRKYVYQQKLANFFSKPNLQIFHSIFIFYFYHYKVIFNLFLFDVVMINSFNFKIKIETNKDLFQSVIL